MTTRYTQKQIDDVARILRHAGLHEPGFGTGQFTIAGQAIADFVDLFAADNPRRCRVCGDAEGLQRFCRGEQTMHQFEGGFNRDPFLAACGLESKGRHAD